MRSALKCGIKVSRLGGKLLSCCTHNNNTHLSKLIYREIIMCNIDDDMAVFIYVFKKKSNRREQFIKVR